MTVKNLSIAFLLLAVATVSAAEPINVGSRRELFLDRYLIDGLTNATLQLHRPEHAGIVLRRELPWAGRLAFGAFGGNGGGEGSGGGGCGTASASGSFTPNLDANESQ